MLRKSNPTFNPNRFNKISLNNLIESVKFICEQDQKEKDTNLPTEPVVDKESKKLKNTGQKGQRGTGGLFVSPKVGGETKLKMDDEQAKIANYFAYGLPANAFLAADALHAQDYAAWATQQASPGPLGALIKPFVSRTTTLTAPAQADVWKALLVGPDGKNPELIYPEGVEYADINDPNTRYRFDKVTGKLEVVPAQNETPQNKTSQKVTARFDSSTVPAGKKLKSKLAGKYYMPNTGNLVPYSPLNPDINTNFPITGRFSLDR